MRENLRVDNILDPDAVSQGEMMVNHLLLPCGEQSGLGGFGVALHPFSKGGKRDLAERRIRIRIESGTQFRFKNI